MSTRILAAVRPNIALGLIASILPMAALATTHDATTFGAIPNDGLDDSSSIQSALNQSALDGHPAYLPPGTYHLDNGLVFANGASLTGNSFAGWSGDVRTLPKLVGRSTTQSAVTLGHATGLSGLVMEFEQADPQNPTVYPPAITVTGIGVLVEKINILNATKGIYTDPAYNVGRLQLHDIFMTSIHQVGVELGMALDVVSLRNIEVWTPPGTSGTFPFTGVGFRIGHIDGLRMSGCFTLGADKGFEFTAATTGPYPGSPIAMLNNCMSDFCSIGLEVNDDTSLTVNGGYFWSHFIGLRILEGSSSITLSSVEIGGNAGWGVFIDGGKDLNMNSCIVKSPHESFNAPALALQNGKSVSISNSVFDATSSPAVHLINKPESLIFSLNKVKAPDEATALSNQMTTSENVIIHNNIFISTQVNPVGAYLDSFSAPGWTGSSEALTADFDKDGRNNLWEYTQNTSPVDASDISHQPAYITLDPTHLLLTTGFPMVRDDGLEVRLQYATDISSWQNLAYSSIEISNYDGGLEYRLPLDSPLIDAEFFRAQISVQ